VEKDVDVAVERRVSVKRDVDRLAGRRISVEDVDVLSLTEELAQERSFAVDRLRRTGLGRESPLEFLAESGLCRQKGPTNQQMCDESLDSQPVRETAELGPSKADG
jgi:hypothetical protein